MNALAGIADQREIFLKRIVMFRRRDEGWPKPEAFHNFCFQLIAFNKQCVLKPARVGPYQPSIGTASRNENACAAFCWPGDVPTIIGRRLWRRELPLALYNVS